MTTTHQQTLSRRRGEKRGRGALEESAGCGRRPASHPPAAAMPILATIRLVNNPGITLHMVEGRHSVLIRRDYRCYHCQGSGSCHWTPPLCLSNYRSSITKQHEVHQSHKVTNAMTPANPYTALLQVELARATPPVTTDDVAAGGAVVLDGCAVSSVTAALYLPTMKLAASMV